MNSVPRILVLDDEPDVCELLHAVLTARGYAVQTLTDPTEFATRLSAFAPQVVVTDVRLPHISGFEVMTEAHRLDPLVSVVVVSGHATIEDAVRAIQSGAEHYLAKPVFEDELARVIARALERQTTRRAASAPLSPDRPVFAAFGLVGRSEPMRALRERIARVALSKGPALVRGESGTGKARVAEAIHASSPRHQQPFVRVGCAGETESVLAAALFGVEASVHATAGAVQSRRAGALERAAGGTVLLDEVGELPPALQARLARVLEHGTFEREGGAETLHVADVRFIATSRYDLRSLVAGQRFREDLYHRLNVLDVEAAPLRMRRGDVPLLVEHLLARLAHDRGGAVPVVTDEVMQLLTRHDWPGNVRELENVLERMLVVAAGAPLTTAALPRELCPQAESDEPPAVPGATFAEIERHAILTTYEACGRNVTRTAEVLGLSPRTIHYRLREYRGQPGRRHVRGMISFASDGPGAGDTPEGDPESSAS